MKKLVCCLAAVMAVSCVLAAENVIHSFAFTQKGEFSAWGSKKNYPAYTFSAANGVAKVEVKEAAADAKTRLQLMPFYKQGFKKGVTYKISGTIKSSTAIHALVCVQISTAPYTSFVQTNGKKWLALNLKPGVAADFAIEFTAAEDITKICRVPGIHIGPAKSGTVIECSNFKVIEITK